MEKFRSRIESESQPGDEEAFTKQHFKVYTEILDRLPSTKVETANNVLTNHEKTIIKEEFEKILRAPR